MCSYIFVMFHNIFVLGKTSNIKERFACCIHTRRKGHYNELILKKKKIWHFILWQDAHGDFFKIQN